MNRHQKVLHIRQKYGLGLLEASKILTSIDIREKVKNANSIEELKDVLIQLVHKAYPLENDYIVSCIIEDFKNEEV